MSWATLPCMRTWHPWLLRSTANKDFANWKRLNCWEKIIEFPARRWKWHMLFHLLRINEPNGFAKQLSGSDWRCSEWTDSNIKSINNLICSQDGQPGHSFLGWKCFPLILQHSLFANFFPSWQAWKCRYWCFLSSSLSSCRTKNN